jgi:hypothetical protein
MLEMLALLWAALAGLGVLLLLAAALLLLRAAGRLERRAQPPTPATDPARWCYLAPGGLPQGPVGLTALRAMLADGRLPPEALAAPLGSADWQPVQRLLWPGERPSGVG